MKSSNGFQYTESDFIAVDRESQTIIGVGLRRSELTQQFPRALILTGGAWNLFLFNKLEAKQNDQKTK